jgi:predicted amidohydrolase YtcJ
MAAYAELLFTGGPVFAGGRTRAQVAVRDGRILAVGPDLSDLSGPVPSASIWAAGC